MHSKRLLAGVLLATTLAVGACSGSDDDGGGAAEGDGTLTVWTTEDQAERVKAQQAILDKFGQQSGTTVKLVAVAEDQLTTVLTASAAADDLPDVIGALSLNGMNQLRTDDLVDGEAAAEIVDKLGRDTFQQRALDLTSADGKQVAVPSDAWSQLLFYRKDLFKAAGLAEPKTYADVQKAASSSTRERLQASWPERLRRIPSPSRRSSRWHWPTAVNWSTTPAT